MTREEAKENIKYIQAYAEGKDLEYYNTNLEEWRPAASPTFHTNVKYRIKPEPKYRPFKNAVECIAVMVNHQPFGWVKNSNRELYHNLSNIDNTSVYTSDNYDYDYDKAFKLFKFIDGTPFGVKEV